MHHEIAKEKIIAITGKIRFEGHFDGCFDNLKETQQESLIFWIRGCVDGKELPLRAKNNIVFIYRMGSNLRAILTKEKNGYYITLFLDKHKYYETEMSKLGF